MTHGNETPAEKPKGKAKAAKTAPAKEPEKQLTLADVRAVLAEKSRAGFTEEGNVRNTTKRRKFNYLTYKYLLGFGRPFYK